MNLSATIHGAVTLFTLSLMLLALSIWARGRGRAVVRATPATGALAFYGVVLVLSTVTSPLAHPLRLWAWGALLAGYLLAGQAPRLTERALSVVAVVLPLLPLGEFLLTGQRPATLANANILAAGILAVWPYSRWLALPGIMATMSRGALLALGSAELLLDRWWATYRPQVVAIIAIVAVGLMLARPATVARRLDTWERALRLAAERPLLGWGAGSWRVLDTVEPGKPHADSALITALAETGAVGALALGAAAVLVVKHAQGRARLALLAVALHALVDDPLAWAGVALLTGLMAGLTQTVEVNCET